MSARDAEAVTTGGAGEIEKLSAWVENQLGATVTHCRREDRWRPGWNLEIEKNGKTGRLYAKGWRNLNSFVPAHYSLEYEARVYRAIEEEGLPIPHVYGVCDEPYTMVMDHLEGDHALGGLESPEQREAVLGQIGALWARLHRIDVSKLEKIGMRVPDSPSGRALSFHDDVRGEYEKTKPRPDPRIAFRNRWLQRNLPAARDRASLLQCDAGQFLHKDGQVVAFIDFEMACVGDPLWDLAKVRVRAIAEGVKDLRPFFRAYEAESGEGIDWQAMVFHTVNAMSVGGMQIAHTLAHPARDCAYDEYLAWYIIGLIVSLEAMAEYQGIELEPVSEPPQKTMRWQPAVDVLTRRVGDGAATDWDSQLTQRLMSLVERQCQFDSDRQYVEDVENLIGSRLTSWVEADEKLEAFVEGADPTMDEKLIRIFYRWARRQVPLVRGLLTTHDSRADLLTTGLQAIAELRGG